MSGCGGVLIAYIGERYLKEVGLSWLINQTVLIAYIGERYLKDVEAVAREVRGRLNRLHWRKVSEGRCEADRLLKEVLIAYIGERYLKAGDRNEHIWIELS